MSLQTIINQAQFITVEKIKTSAQSISRSGRMFTAELASAIPYRFTVGMHGGLQYSLNRGLLETLDTLDRTVESNINIGSSNAGLAYITAYQGDSTATSGISIIGSSGNNLIINAAGAGTGTFLFKKGDFIQPASGYRYPFQVTADVAHTNAASVSIPIHRPYIEQTGYSLNGKGLTVGSGVSWYVKMITKPLHSIVPHDRIEFNTDFQLIEVIE
jgi:hypothetical protein